MNVAVIICHLVDEFDVFHAGIALWNISITNPWDRGGNTSSLTEVLVGFVLV